MTEYWFKPKTYGYGATPINWKGWVSTSVFAAVLIVLMMTMVLPAASGRPEWQVLLGWVLVAGVTAVFCQFAKVRTNGEWRWRWGKDEI